MSRRLDNPVTLSHEEAKAVAHLLDACADTYGDHARRTRSVPIRAHCESRAAQARALCGVFAQRLYTWEATPHA